MLAATADMFGLIGDKNEVKIQNYPGIAGNLPYQSCGLMRFCVTEQTFVREHEDN
jgi:hypothetical protein